MHTTLNYSVFDRFPTLETERLQLRAHLQDDAEQLFAIRSHPHVMQYMDMPPAQSLEEVKKRIANIQSDFSLKKGLNWVLTLKGEDKMIGYCGFWRLIETHCRAEIGYSMHPYYWNKGYMTEATNAILNFGFQQFHLHTVEANINPENQRSSGLLERLGFQREAYFRESFLFNGTFGDSAIYSLIGREWLKREAAVK